MAENENNPLGVSREEGALEEQRNEEERSRSIKDSRTLEKIADFLEPVASSVGGLAASQLEAGSLTDDATTKLTGGLSKLTEETKDFAKRSVDEIKSGYDKFSSFSSSMRDRISDFFNGVKNEFPGLGGALSKPTGSGSPSEDEMRKHDRGAAYIGDKIDELINGDKQEKKDDGFTLPGINLGLPAGGLGGVLGNLFRTDTFTKFAKSGAGKALSVGSLAIGLYQGAADAVEGVIRSEDWGVSKIAGGLGGFLGGGGSGLKNSFSQAGKWAMIGFGAGNLIVPGLGGIIGGVGGAVLGGILGFFGGEKIAKALEGVGAWVKDQFTETIPKAIMGAFSFLGEKLIDFGSFAMDNSFNPVKMVINGIVAPAIKSIGEWVSKNKNTNVVAGVLDKLFSAVSDFFGGVIEEVKYIGHIFNQAGNPAGGLIDVTKYLAGSVVRKGVLQAGKVSEASRDEALWKVSSRLGYDGALSKDDYKSLSEEERSKFDMEYGSFFRNKGMSDSDIPKHAYQTGGIASTPQIATLAENGESEWVIPERYLPKALTDGTFKTQVDNKDMGKVEELLSNLISAVKENGPMIIPVPTSDWTTIR